MNCTPFTKTRFTFLFFCLSFSCILFAQEKPFTLESSAETSKLDFRVKKIKNAAIQMDGVLDESEWMTAETIKKFRQFFPSDSLDAFGDTQIKMLYDDENLYIGITCLSKGSDFISNSLRRDYDLLSGDNITLMFDTYNDQRNALAFGINAFGVRREALILNGGIQERDFYTSWDNKWNGVSQKGETGWTAELVIPFKTLRYKEGSSQWRFNAFRYDTQFNEMSSWVNIPRNLLPIDLGCMGKMHWEEPLTKPGKNISLIPYLATAVSRDFKNLDQTKAVGNVNVGGDVKISITPSLNLDLTVNPDFSQVEVDRQVTNLSRFELFFPERRQFFLENADLFDRFGLGSITPFFSRRIGIVVDTTTGQNIQNPILYGARLSGKVNEKFRIGLLNMQTAKDLENGVPSFNYSVASAEHRVFTRSHIGVMMVNKQATNSELFEGNFNRYNRLIGIEYRLATADNKWKGTFNYQKTFSPNAKGLESSHFATAVYNDRKFRFEWTQLHVGEDYNPEVGFISRKDCFMYSPEASINFYPKKGALSRHSVGMDATFIHKLGKNDPYLDAFKIEEISLRPFWNLWFNNSSTFRFQVIYSDLTLLVNFDPTRLQSSGVFLPGGSRHQFSFINMRYQSDRRKKFHFNLSPTIGQFFDGFRAGVRGGVTYRYRHLGFVSLDYNYNYIALGEPFKKVNTWLFGPRVDLTLTKSLFLTTFVQYNNQLDNLNINTRLQWRFKPVSDFYISYTDNYLALPFDQFATKNRAVVAKFTYWLNL